MWIECAIGSALLLGAYDFFKKKSLKRNSVLMGLTVTTVLSALLTLPSVVTGYDPYASETFIPWRDDWKLMLKAVIVTVSWLSGLAALKYLPLTTAGTLKATRPVFVVLFSVLFMGERLNGWQTAGILAAFVSLFMLSSASSREGIRFTRSKGVLYMLVSVISGVCSALWDKLIMKAMPPVYVLGHTNLYIALLMLAILLVTRWVFRPKGALPVTEDPSGGPVSRPFSLLAREAMQPFVFDVNLVFISLFITGADFLYFLALNQEGALLSVISIVRRLSVVITFLLGALFLKERNLGRKALALFVLLMSVLISLFGSNPDFLSWMQHFSIKY